MAIIKSLVDTDLYKLSMQRAVLERYNGVPVTYKFINRRPEGRFNDAFAKAFAEELKAMGRLFIQPVEIDFLMDRCPYLGKEYLRYLMDYHFNPREVRYEFKDGELQLEISGCWDRVILWEVPLMALISELYFIHCDREWTPVGQEEKVRSKAETLRNVSFADFGTRRRRSLAIQNLVVDSLCQTKVAGICPHFVGTSNVYLACLHNTKAIGTMAHEWIMGVSAMEGLRHANRHAMRIWSEVYKGDLGIALTDTYGLGAFLNDFDVYQAKLFDGVRHDSGSPDDFAELVIQAYHARGIDPRTKTIVFSDGLDAAKAAELQAKYGRDIKLSFGIGTNLTNDFEGSRALNMVIKMTSCNGLPVVKLSDVPEKATGDRDALRVARWTFFGIPLDT